MAAFENLCAALELFSPNELRMLAEIAQEGNGRFCAYGWGASNTAYASKQLKRQCEYCGSICLGDRPRCESCGAPRTYI